MGGGGGGEVRLGRRGRGRERWARAKLMADTARLAEE